MYLYCILIGLVQILLEPKVFDFFMEPFLTCWHRWNFFRKFHSMVFQNHKREFSVYSFGRGEAEKDTDGYYTKQFHCILCLTSIMKLWLNTTNTVTSKFSALNNQQAYTDLILPLVSISGFTNITAVSKSKLIMVTDLSIRTNSHDIIVYVTFWIMPFRILPLVHSWYECLIPTLCFIRYVSPAMKVHKYYMYS